MDEADRALFVGRARELAVVDAFLVDSAQHRILLVHGDGGIGKSALLREIGRRAAEAGSDVLARDGRDVVRADQLDDLLTPADDASRPVIILDEADHLGANLISVRDSLLHRLPSDARLVVASRQRPHPSWWSDGLDAVTIALTLAPLDEADARALLGSRGLVDPGRQREVLAWAGGFPLALTAAVGTSWSQAATPSESDLENRIYDLLGGDQIAGVDPRVLEVAAVAWAVDARLLAAALPGHPTREGMRELWELPVAQRTGPRVRLHSVLAHAVRRRLRAERPAYYDALVRRIAVHLARRARLGEVQAVLELGELIEDPGIRAGYGVGASATHAVDRLRPGDLAGLRSAFGTQPWWGPAERWLDVLPEYTTVVRGTSGELALVGVYAPFAAVEAALQSAEVEDPGLRALLEFARREADPDQTIVGIASMYLDPPAAHQVLPVGNASMIARANTTDIRWVYSRVPDPSPVPPEFLAAMGYTEVEGAFGEGLGALRTDLGPEGGIGYFLQAVLAEHPGHTDGERPSDEAHEERLREVLELAAQRPGLGEAAILKRLHVSRATYYRLLREARERST